MLSSFRYAQFAQQLVNSATQSAFFYDLLRMKYAPIFRLPALPENDHDPVEAIALRRATRLATPDFSAAA